MESAAMDHPELPAPPNAGNPFEIIVHWLLAGDNGRRPLSEFGRRFKDVLLINETRKFAVEPWFDIRVDESKNGLIWMSLRQVWGAGESMQSFSDRIHNDRVASKCKKGHELTKVKASEEFLIENAQCRVCNKSTSAAETYFSCIVCAPPAASRFCICSLCMVRAPREQLVDGSSGAATQSGSSAGSVPRSSKRPRKPFPCGSIVTSIGSQPASPERSGSGDHVPCWVDKVAKKPGAKLVFVHTPKTGGQFVAQILKDLGIRNLGHEHKVPPRPASSIVNPLAQQDQTTLYFTVIREPIARFESFLHYRLHEKRAREDWPKRLAHFHGKSSKATLDEVVGEMTDIELMGFDPFRTLNYWASKVDVCVTIEKMPEFLNHCGYTYDSSKYRAVNVSDKRRGAFSDDTRKRLRRVFKEDIALFEQLVAVM